MQRYASGIILTKSKPVLWGISQSITQTIVKIITYTIVSRLHKERYCFVRSILMVKYCGRNTGWSREQHSPKITTNNFIPSTSSPSLNKNPRKLSTSSNADYLFCWLFSSRCIHCFEQLLAK